MELALIKQHLSIIDSEADFDTLIIHYEQTAETAIAAYIHNDYNPLNKIHEQAKLLLIGTWFEFRESDITLRVSTIPSGVSFLLDMDMSVAV